MGIHDRPYMQQDYQPPGGRITFGMPKPGKAVKWLLIANIVMFVLQIFLGRQMEQWLTVTAVVWWEVWRYLTFQFLHADPFHLLFNMLGLYFLGMYLERAWGTRRFLTFYLVCGAVAGLTHVALSWSFRTDLFVSLLGASGGVYAVVLACAILFPHIRVIVILFPMSIRMAAALFLGIAIINVLIGIRSALAGGPLSGGISHVAHLGGAAAAAVWVYVIPKLRGASGQVRGRINRGAWQRKMRKRADEEAQIDRILSKIRNEGLDSLTNREKKILREATERQRRQESELYRL